MKKYVVLIVVAAIAAASVWVGLQLRHAFAPTSLPETAEDVDRAFARGDFEQALQIATRLLEGGDESAHLRMLAGEAASRFGRHETALEHYSRIPDQAPEACLAQWSRAEVLYQMGKTEEALNALAASLRADPNFIPARARAVYVLNVLGRRRETLPHLLALLKSDEGTIEHLLLIGNISKEVFDSAEVDRLEALRPGNIDLNLPRAIHAREQGDYATAAKLLEALLAKKPELLETRLQQGWLLLATDTESLSAWVEGLPAGAYDNPDAWYLAGQAAQARDENENAVRCFLEAIQRDAGHLQAHIAVAQALNRANAPERAALFAAKAGQLQRMNLALDQIFVSRKHLPPIKQAAEIALELGRLWEAIGWSAYALSLDGELAWPQYIFDQVRPRITHSTPRTLPEANLAVAAAWKSEYPMPATSQRIAHATPSVREGERDKGSVRFENVADAVGIDFVLAPLRDATLEGKRMFEITGAGVGAIDFDRDGWCDLYAVQSNHVPPGKQDGAQEPAPSDRLFRCGGKGSGAKRVTFSDATSPSRIAESAFGQGVAIADLDCDGFDDVYVCNFGRNQLWLNQGDGTFVDGTALIVSTLPVEWTVSAAIGDVNLDGLPDIYDANYVTGEDVLTRRCPVGGKPRACSPLLFQAAPQVLWLSGDNGNWVEFNNSRSEPLAGYGLGVVMSRTVGQHWPTIFTAIDQQANLLLTVNEDAASPQGIALTDEAILRGIAFDAAGRSQACMGIAAGDVNSDGHVDFYVTNFYNESNTLYLQDDGNYRDATASANLVGPSMPVLGFGTQFVDFDLDGKLDIAVLNGHIDDHSHIQVPYKMRPQLYKQTAKGNFVELDSKECGQFFTKPALGRALTTLDFNRDGRVDLVASDLEAPLAVLENQARPVGESVVVTLVGTRSDRNAFFTIGHLSATAYQQTQQLIAGSGYMASNERVLRYSVPAGTGSMKLELEWPSGVREVCHDIVANKHHVIVEGRGVVQSFAVDVE